MTTPVVVDPPAALSVSGVTKVFANGTVANDNVDLTVTTGSIHSLMGENGAGKSTLMRVVHGLEQPDEGLMTLHGDPYAPRNAREAIAAGVGMVHQHFRLVDQLTVTENITLGREPRRHLLVDRAAARDRVAALIADLEISLDPDAPVAGLSVGQKQRVEILRVLDQGAQLLILDEPSAVLTPQEVDGLFRSLRRLVSEGRTVLFITHKLREVIDHSDHVTVMRDGRTVASQPTAQVTEAELARMMVGRVIAASTPTPPVGTGRTILDVRKLHVIDPTGRVRLDDISLTVNAGEILGIAGVDGNGQDELVDVLAGLQKPDGGAVFLDGTALPFGDPAAVRRRGVGHIAADRIHRGTAAHASIAENLAVARLATQQSRRGIIDLDAMGSDATQAIAAYDIRGGHGTTTVAQLSGGNAQKVVIARELDGHPMFLLAAQPTRGVDVGAIEYIHAQLRRQRDSSTAILLVSTELAELRALADRIVVMQGGMITARFDDPSTVEDDALGRAMAGVTDQPAAR